MRAPHDGERIEAAFDTGRRHDASPRALPRSADTPALLPVVTCI